MPTAGSIPGYWVTAKEELSAADSVLAEVIARNEEPVLSSKGDLFLNLVSAIVSQQISTTAARTIWGRFEGLVGEVHPKSVLSRSHEELRGCGLSGRKAEYILEIAEAWQNGYADINWDGLSDEEVMDALVELRGVGTWTAEMVLIFTLLRPDVFPVGDIGVVRAVERLYSEGERMSNDELIAKSQDWRPWRTVATWYLWRSIDPEPVQY
jgi:DNA-3-methyladenine glycosylase II